VEIGVQALIFRVGREDLVAAFVQRCLGVISVRLRRYARRAMLLA
jgi:hypothetical protein